MRILIAYDGSESADAALTDLKLAGLDVEADVLVMSVADVFVPPPVNEKDDNMFPMNVPEVIKRAHERARHELEQVEDLVKLTSARMKSIFPNWNISYVAEADSPAWAVLRKADDWKPDLIVMGARGHSVFGGRLILGSHIATSSLRSPLLRSYRAWSGQESKQTRSASDWRRRFV